MPKRGVIPNNVSFRDGYKFVGGARVAPMGRRTFTSSDGYTQYTATFWADQTTSCNCPGWSFNGRCKHARQVTQFDVTQVSRPELEPVADVEQTYRRKIQLD